MKIEHRRFLQVFSDQLRGLILASTIVITAVAFAADDGDRDTGNTGDEVPAVRAVGTDVREGHDHKDHGHKDHGHKDHGHKDHGHKDHGHKDHGHKDHGHKDHGHKDHGHKDHGHKDHGHKDDGHKDHGHKDHGHKDHGHKDHGHKDHGHKDHGHKDHGHKDHGHKDHGHKDHGHKDHGHKDHGHKDHGHKDHASDKASATNHSGHDEHDHDQDKGIAVSDETRREFGIETQVAAGGSLSRTKRLTGEVVFNEDRYAHVVPGVPGFARDIKVRVGDRVKAGQLLAVLHSRELAEAKSRYLSALSRMRIVEVNHRREARLWRDKINTERALLEAKQALTQAEVERRSSERQLYSLGLSAEQVAAVEGEPDELLTRYEIRAPIDGVVITRHIVVGEIIDNDGDQPPFVIADLSKVWVNLTVYARDLAVIERGQTAILTTEDKNRSVVAPIDWISPSLAESTRSTTARLSIDNQDGYWRPGMFVNALITVGTGSAAVVVPKSAVQKVDGNDVVFVEREDALVATPVTLGASDGSYVEILSGLERGQRYVAENAFSVKAEAGKEAFGGHGHAH